MVGPVDGLVERRLVGIYLEDGTPRIITAFSVDLISVIAFLVAGKDLLDVLVGNPMELQEELPGFHITLD